MATRSALKPFTGQIGMMLETDPTISQGPQTPARLDPLLSYGSVLPGFQGQELRFPRRLISPKFHSQSL